MSYQISGGLSREQIQRAHIIWAVYHSASGYPWYRQNYDLAIEPQSSMPEGIDEATAAGTALCLV